MNNEQIKEITSKAIEQPIAALNEGPSETLTCYLAIYKPKHYPEDRGHSNFTCRPSPNTPDFPALGTTRNSNRSIPCF